MTSDPNNQLILKDPNIDFQYANVPLHCEYGRNGAESKMKKVKFVICHE